MLNAAVENLKIIRESKIPPCVHYSIEYQRFQVSVQEFAKEDLSFLVQFLIINPNRQLKWLFKTKLAVILKDS